MLQNLVEQCPRRVDGILTEKGKLNLALDIQQYMNKMFTCPQTSMVYMNVLDHLKLQIIIKLCQNKL